MTEFRDIWLHAHNMLRSGRQMINEKLRPLDLTSAQGNVLVHLFTHGLEMGQEQLVQQLDISKPAVSRVLDALEKKGLVVRQRDPDDRRAYRVLVTDKALKIRPQVEQIYNDLFAMAMRGVSREELESFIALLRRISDNFIRQQSQESPHD